MSRAHAACSVPKSHGQVVIPAAVVEALDACKQACRPGATYGDIFDAHAKALDNTGFGEHKLNACGYSLGALHPPTWMDGPMIYAGNSVVVEPNPVIFMHMILLDWDHNPGHGFWGHRGGNSRRL